MIYVTGDTHGKFERLGSKHFPEGKSLGKDDYVIICGDFGIWDDSKGERRWLDWIDAKSFTTLFVDGNHENFDLLYAFPVEEWNGGKARRVRPSVIHLMRGQVYDIAGKRFFTMGGASSHDIEGGILEPDDPDIKRKKQRLSKQGMSYRINRVSWWAEELPSDEEYAEARKNLDACGWKVDYIVSHCAPSNVAEIVGGNKYGQDKLTVFFEEINERCEFERWFCGHYHTNKTIDKMMFLYTDFSEVH